MRRKGKDIQREKDTFTVLMTSLSVILLAFFILLNSIASIDNKRVKKALGSLTGTFGILPGGFRTEKGETILPNWAVDLGIENSIQSLEEFFQESGKEGEIHIDETDEGLVLNISSRVFFFSGGAELRSDGIAALDAVAEIIKTTDMPFRIAGHTDNIPIHNKGSLQIGSFLLPGLQESFVILSRNGGFRRPGSLRLDSGNTDPWCQIPRRKIEQRTGG